MLPKKSAMGIETKKETKMNSTPNNNNHSSSVVVQEEEGDKAGFTALYLLSIEAFSHALSTSAELGLFDIIASASSDAGLTASDITAHLHVKKPDLACDVIDRMLKILTCYNLLTSSPHKRNDDEDDVVQMQYSLTLTGKAFSLNGDGTNNSFPVSTPDRSWTEAWLKLKDAIVDGEIPYEKAHGVSIFKDIGKDSDSVKHFYKFMSGFSYYMKKKLVDNYDGFGRIKTLVDVGGGDGLLLHLIVSKYPQINAINFDLPQAIKEAPPYPGVKHVEGDMFLEIPSADAIIMKGVLHNWSDEQCIKILKSCYNALVGGGKVIVVADIIPEVLEPSATAKFLCQIDLEMFVLTGGKQRTEKQYKSLGKAAGFSGFQLICYVAYNAFAVIEFYE